MNKKLSQLDLEDVTQQLAEIREKAEKEKIPLSKEVEKYTRGNLRKVQEKLAKREPVFPSDMEFIRKVRMWILMPREWREKYASIEEMEAAVEVKEAKKRAIDLKQWAALMMMAGFKVQKGEEIKWIDKFCQFPGNSKIVVNRGLDLRDCIGLMALPDNLHVARELKLNGCTGLKVLPENLHVGGGLQLTGCTGLTVIPDNLRVGGFLDLEGCTGLTVLPDSLYVGVFLDLSGCTGLKVLPENLHVAGFLYLDGCSGLTALPDNLMVEGDLFISKSAVNKIKRDAQRLSKAGKIKGVIRFL